MRQFVCKYWAILAMGLLVSMAAACGPESAGPIEINADEACEDHEECDESAPFCDEDGRCVECLEIEDCPGDAGCVDGECILDDTSCEVDSECPFSSQVCQDQQCRFVPRQCTTEGQECELGAPTRTGFACEDLGRGARCYSTCFRYRICADGTPLISHECDDGAACIVDDVTEPVCQPAECEDFFDTEDGCVELIKHDPDAVANGTHCIDVGQGTLVCAGAGTAEEGEHCEETTDCAAGLTCVNRLPQHGGFGAPLPTLEGSLGEDSFCARACDGDDMCGDGEACIGDDEGIFDGVGICGDRCEPFGTDVDQCSEDIACIPVSREDGLCFRETTREADYYEPCNSTEQCPDTAECLDLFGEGGRQCYPLCDPRGATAEENNATCPQAGGDRLLGGDCVDLSSNLGRNPAIGTAVCLEACRDSDDWGQDGCSAEDMACSPVGGNTGWCFPSGEATLGGVCNSPDDCASGMHCDMKGDGTGICRSYCQPGEQTNPNLGCVGEEACIPMDGYDNLGECRLPCDPGFDGTDPHCPELQQNCFDAGGMSYCAASGNLQHEEDCGTPLVQNCAPGMVCAKRGTTLNAVLTSPFRDIDEGETAQCVMTCEPFVGQFGSSGCPTGYACSPVTPQGESRSQGHCVPMVENPRASLQECLNSERGLMCGENSFCIGDTGSSCGPDRSMCLQFCDYISQTGCTHNTTCEQGFIGGPLLGFLGLCL